MSKNGRGEGSIVHRKDGRWQGMVSCGYKPDGSLNRKYFYGKTRAEAADKVQRALAELKDGTFIDKNTNPTVEAWLNEWLWTYKKNSLKPTTFEQYETLIRMHIVPAVGQKKLIELSVRDLQILYNSKTGILSARSVRLMNIILHGALEQANLLGLVNRNVTKGVVLPKEEPKEMRVLTRDEQRKLIEILKTDRYGNAYLFGLCTGLRRGELLALTWDDYDAANKTIYVNKTLNRVKNYADDGRGRTKLVITSPKTMKSRRLVPLMDLAIEALNRQREYQKADKDLLDELYRDDNLIFCGEMGNIIDPGNFNRKFGKFLELAGIDGATPHTMRHSFATRGLESGISIKIMQELLGHSSINVTGNIYTHVLLETKKGEIDKLNKMFPASNGETEIE